MLAFIQNYSQQVMSIEFCGVAEITAPKDLLCFIRLTELQHEIALAQFSNNSSEALRLLPALLSMLCWAATDAVARCTGPRGRKDERAM